MPSYRAPGIYVEELSSGSRPIAPAATSTAAFIGIAQKGPVNRATLITSISEFQKKFGGPVRDHYLSYAVRHFFEQGGSRCYVVRVAHYTDIEDEGTMQASEATRGFDGTLPDGTAISPALTVKAISPGIWGRDLEARVITSSKFSARLAGNITAGDATQIALTPNDEVRVGSLLWIVEEATGQINSVHAATSEITFSDPPKLTRFNSTNTVEDLADPIAKDTPVFGPGFAYLAKVPALTPIGSGLPTAPDGKMGLSLAKVDGTSLRPGDTVIFALKEARVVVTRVSVQASPPATIAHFAKTTLPAFTQGGTRVYARDFTLVVRRQNTILETHENLSLANTNTADHVSVRLDPATGASQYITAVDETDTQDRGVVNDSGFSPFQGGNDGLTGLAASDFTGSETLKTGLHALTPVRDAAILAIPNASEEVTKAAIAYVEKRGDLFLILEEPNGGSADVAAYRLKLSSKYAALYHPWIKVTDELTGKPMLMPPSGAVAGIYSFTDVKRGVHKAPAGLDVGKVVVATGIKTALTKAAYDTLYPVAINAILKLSDGIHVWGSRTLSPDPEWLQINVRRLFNFLEKSIETGTQWVTFEPNDPTLWKSIERNIRDFLRIQWREGKLVGTTEQQAFFVHCNAETNPPEVVDAGQVVTVIGAAPSRPAEFVIFRIRQKVGQSPA